MNLGFLAHDAKKILLLNFCTAYKDILLKHEIYATGTTGEIIENLCSLNVHNLLAGSMGGEHQLACMVEAREIDAVFLFRDPDIINSSNNGYIKLYEACDLNNIPLATNLSTAEILINAIERGELTRYKKL